MISTAPKTSKFTRFAQFVSHLTGRPIFFVAAVVFIGTWAVLGPLFDYSDTWQLVVNTATSIITFLMVFVIQSTQNRDTAAMHIKLDEMIRVTDKARKALLCLEELEESELEALRRDYERLAEVGRAEGGMVVPEAIQPPRR